MSPTLFRYIFRDLIRIFLLAAVVIAGVMSFGGLLRPLSERGLDAGQVARMLGWLLPAMATYSLPVAALFATTFVYGRLAADNETTAIRAAGIPSGLTGICFPAMILGICGCAVSLGLLCFVVPAANLQVERVVYSNLARLAANEINRSKRLTFSGGGGGLTLTADRATVLDTQDRPDSDAHAAGSQVVQFENVYIFRYERAPGAQERYEVPREVYTARRATAFIQPPGHFLNGQVFETGLRDDRFYLTVVLQDGLKFPRVLSEGATLGSGPLIAAVGASQIGPIALNSPVRSNTKFLDIRELHRLYRRPQLSREIGEYVTDLLERDQRSRFLETVRNEARDSASTIQAGDETFSLLTRNAQGVLGDERLFLTAGEEGLIELTHRRAKETVTVIAPRATVAAEPLTTTSGPRLRVVYTFADATVTVTPNGGEPESTSGRTFERVAVTKLPDYLPDGSNVTAQELFTASTLGTRESRDLESRLRRQQNAVLAEIHARLSFAFACLILPIVGAALGMLFRSGNFLTAFAASVVPAMLCIVLISMGQGVSEDVPTWNDGRWSNPLAVGLPMLWSGNIVVLLAAILLLHRLRRGP